MKTLFCYECNKNYVKKHGELKLKDSEIGEFKVENIMYHKCEGCGDRIILPDEAKLIDVVRTKLRIINYLGKTSGTFDSQHLAEELRTGNLAVEKALIELVNERKLNVTALPSKIGKMRNQYTLKSKSLWEKLIGAK